MAKISEDLIGHSFATGEERRISLLIGRTEFVTSEKFRIYFSRHRLYIKILYKKTAINFFSCPF